MITTQEEYNQSLIKHLSKLLDIAKDKQPLELLKKIERYYKGSFNVMKDKVSNQRNVIKGIVEAKTTMIIDSQIKTTVIPQTKNLADPNSLQNICEIAGIVDECLKDVFKQNNFDSWRQMVVRDLVKKVAINETYWCDEDNEVRLRRIPFYKFYPDPSMGNDPQTANFMFIEESFSPITLKVKYPQFADKLEKFNEDDNKESREKNNPAGIVTATVGDQTNQAFSYGDPGSVAKNAKDIKVWKVYLKDDSTFEAEETEKNANKEDLETLKLKYPNGRMIMYVAGSKDIVLEDKPIDYSFGYPIDICYNIESETIWECQGDVEPLFENQDRINNAYTKAKEMIGKSGSWILNDPKNNLSKSDFVNKTVLEIENKGNPGNVPEVLTNNTIEKFNLMIDYMEMLKKDSADIARLNEQMISGNQEETTTSGEQVKALNESPLSGIRTLQRNYKDFLVNVTNKIIALIQQYYTTARIIRLAEGSKFIALPTRGATKLNAEGQPEPQPIEMYENTPEGIQLIKKIQGNLDIGRYEIEVVAGSERPRSKSENANLMLQLYQAGMLGQGTEAIAEILEELDVPNRRKIIDRLKKQEEEAPKPTIFDDELLAKNFKETFSVLEGFTAAKRMALQNAGLPDKPDSLEDAPVQEVTKESEVTDVVQMAPALISDNPQIQQLGQQLAVKKDEETRQHEVNLQNNKMAAMQAGKQNAGLQQK